MGRYNYFNIRNKHMDNKKKFKRKRRQFQKLRKKKIIV